MDNLIELISYVLPKELSNLESQLKQNKVNYLVKAHGGTIGYEDDDYYKIFVERSDLGIAKKIVNKFRAKTFVNSRRCPKCKSTAYEPAKKLTFFEKIFFLGTTAVQCKKCKTKYPL